MMMVVVVMVVMQQMMMTAEQITDQGSFRTGAIGIIVCIIIGSGSGRGGRC